MMKHSMLQPRRNQGAEQEGTAHVSARASGRIPYIDLMETIAMLFVVAYHLSNCRYKFLYDPGAETTINYYLRCVFVSCVPLFLTVNGFLMFRHRFDMKRHLRRTLQYVVLTLFWGVVTLAEYNYVYGVPFAIGSFLDDLLTWRGGVIHLWYMGALVIIYLLFPVLKLVYDKNRKLLRYVVLIVGVMTFGNKLLNYGLTIANGLRGAEQVWVEERNWFSMFNPVPGIPAYTLVYFCLGAFLEDFLRWLDRFSRAKVNLLAVAGLVLFCAVHALVFGLLWHFIPYYYCPIWYGYETVTGALITLCVLVLCANYRGKRAPAARLFQWISTNTLGIYFIHMVVIYPFKEKLLTIGVLNNLPGNLLCAAAVTGVCLLITALLRRIPLIRKLVS